MKERSIPHQFDMVHPLGYRNLLVSGCSFTYNNSDQYAVTWPYYLRDMAGFQQVYDCSMPGAGNYHICHGLMWACETNDFDPRDTLVIVMWSGHCRDDMICSADAITDYAFDFAYSAYAVSGITGGNAAGTGGNVPILRELDRVKSPYSRSIENYLYVSSLYHYLRSRQFNFLFLDYLDRKIPSRSKEFEITAWLDTDCAVRYQSMFNHDIENLYKFAVQQDMLMQDDFHPSPGAHRLWTQKHLLPGLTKINLGL